MAAFHIALLTSYVVNISRHNLTVSSTSSQPTHCSQSVARQLHLQEERKCTQSCGRGLLATKHPKNRPQVNGQTDRRRWLPTTTTKHPKNWPQVNSQTDRCRWLPTTTRDEDSVCRIHTNKRGCAFRSTFHSFVFYFSLLHIGFMILQIVLDLFQWISQTLYTVCVRKHTFSNVA